MSDDVLYEVVDGVGTITLNRPHRHNAMTDESAAALEEILHRARADDDARVLLLHGAGPSFCTGRDTAQLGVRSTGLSHFQHLQRSLARKLDFTMIEKPIVAAVHGNAIGGGFEMALACDIRVVAVDARLSLPEINWGIMTDRGGTVLTTLLAGPGRAMYLVLTGDTITGEQAHSWGLADFVEAAEDVLPRARAIATSIAAKPPVNVRLAKRMIADVHDEVVRRGLRSEAMALTAIYHTDDYAEARAARQEGRPATFTGR